MLLSNLLSPISIFNIGEFGIDIQNYSNKIKNEFLNLEWDGYLYRQKQIEFLSKRLDKSLVKYSQTIFKTYYVNDDISILNPLLNHLSIDELNEFKTIRPTRRRSFASFCTKQNIDGEIICLHNKQSKFVQAEALVDDSRKDWRQIERIFPRAKDELIGDELKQLLIGISKRIFNIHSKARKLDIGVHFTQIVAYPNVQASNSPEGIHQDGMDYIVSALVVERNNISGGKSIVYGSDKKSPILEVILDCGMGLFQPDKNTDLWHVVEPVAVIDNNAVGYRSTIGIDISVLK